MCYPELILAKKGYVVRSKPALLMNLAHSGTRVYRRRSLVICTGRSAVGLGI